MANVMQRPEFWFPGDPVSLTSADRLPVCHVLVFPALSRMAHHALQADGLLGPAAPSSHTLLLGTRLQSPKTTGSRSPWQRVQLSVPPARAWASKAGGCDGSFQFKLSTLGSRHTGSFTVGEGKYICIFLT